MQYHSLFFATTQLRGLDCKIGTTYFGLGRAAQIYAECAQSLLQKGSGLKSRFEDRQNRVVELFERIWLSKDRDAGAEVHAAAHLRIFFCVGNKTVAQFFEIPMLCHLHTPKNEWSCSLSAISLFRSFFSVS